MKGCASYLHCPLTLNPWVIPSGMFLIHPHSSMLETIGDARFWRELRIPAKSLKQFKALKICSFFCSSQVISHSWNPQVSDAGHVFHHHVTHAAFKRFWCLKGKWKTQGFLCMNKHTSDFISCIKIWKKEYKKSGQSCPCWLCPQAKKDLSACISSGAF